MQHAILILGMHRSGTSALSRVVNLLGVDLNRELMDEKKDNERGFWESEEVMHLHDDLLLALGTSWDETIPLPEHWWRRHEVAPVREALLALLRADFSDSACWCVKDPRLCRLLPLWLDILSELRCQPCCVVMVRNPAEVVDSLRARSGLPPGLGYPLWLDQNLTAEELSRATPRAFVSYEQLLTDWRGTTATIAKRLGIAWPRSLDEAAAEIDAFLAPALRHHTLPADTVANDREISGQVAATYRTLQEVAANGESPAALETFDRQRAQLRQAERLYARALASGRGERGLLQLRIAELEAEQARLERELTISENLVALRDEQLARANAVFETGIQVKAGELALANENLSAAIARKDEQIAVINEFFETRSQELERLRHEFDEQSALVAQLRDDLRARTQERDEATAQRDVASGQHDEATAAGDEATERLRRQLADLESELARRRSELDEITSSRWWSLARLLGAGPPRARSQGSQHD